MVPIQVTNEHVLLMKWQTILLRRELPARGLHRPFVSQEKNCFTVEIILHCQIGTVGDASVFGCKIKLLLRSWTNMTT